MVVSQLASGKNTDFLHHVEPFTETFIEKSSEIYNKICAGKPNGAVCAKQTLNFLISLTTRTLHHVNQNEAVHQKRCMEGKMLNFVYPDDPKMRVP